MKDSACIGAISLACWVLGGVLMMGMSDWGLWALLGAGLFLWCGAATAVMCLACLLIELAKGLEKCRH